MELILSAISAGGLVGAANQYAIMHNVSKAAKAGVITLSPNTNFISSYWFISLVGFLWMITIAPAFSTLLSPGFGNVINTIANFISGFLVPVSSALLSLSAIGVIINLNPELGKFLETFKFLNSSGDIGATGYVVAIASAGSAAALTGIRGLAKPAMSSATGTAGTISAPIYTILENTTAIILMALAYWLVKINPWLLVILFGFVSLFIFALLGFTIYQLFRLKKGFGKVLDLSQNNPRAGIAILAEFFVWGIGWFAWKHWGRGVIMIFLLSLWLIAFFLLQPIVVAMLSFFPPIIPIISVLSIILLLIMFVFIGFNSSKSLMRAIEAKLLTEENAIPQ